MKSENCLYCHCAEQCVYIFNDKEPCPLIKLEAEEGVPRVQYFRWIPCSKELPEKDGKYLVTIKGWRSQKLMVVTALFSESTKTFDPSCIAWMELPEPYRGKE